MLIATFTVSLLLFSIALLRFTVLGKMVGTLTGCTDDRRRDTARSLDLGRRLIVARGALAGLLVLLTRTNLGLHMRAARRTSGRRLVRRARQLDHLGRHGPLRRARRGGRGTDDRRDALHAPTTRCATRSSSSRRRRRRDRPAVDRRARRVLDRLRHVVHGGKAADLRPARPEIPRHRHLRPGHPHAAPAPGRPLRRAQAPCWRAYEALARPARRPGRADRARRILGQLPLQRTRDRVRARAGVHGDRRPRATSSSATPA